MAFSHARQNSQVKLSANEMFEISQEISRDFSPIISSTIPGFVQSDKHQVRALPVTGRKLVWLKGTNNPETISHIKLSRLELFEISRQISLQFSPRFASRMPEIDFHSPLSAQELLAVSEEISREFAPKAMAGKSELVLMAVDPVHLHAYWKLDQSEVITDQEKHPEQALTMRVYPESDESMKGAEAEVWIEIAIDSSQGQQKLDLPAASGATRYSAVIGKSSPDQGFIAYARSNIIHVPRASAEDFRGMENKKAPGVAFLPRHRHLSGQGKYTES